MQKKLLWRLFLGVIMLQCMPFYGVKAMTLHHKKAYITLQLINENEEISKLV